VTTDRSLVDTWAGFKAVVDPEPGFVRAARIQLKATDATVGNADVAFTAAAGPLHAAQLTLEDNNGDDRAADTGLVTWTSATPAKATVSATGVVTAVSAGTSVITATVDGLTKTATVTVT
jgi:hypothetical protein